MTLLLRVCLFASLVYASSSVASTPSACGGEHYRQFDFWLGEWTVMGGLKADQLQGHNRIERSADGCRIIEHWSGASGTQGMSINAYDATHKRWRQFWVGGDGLVLQLEGGLHDGAMVMQGTLPLGKNKQQLQKITWTPKPDGSVIQLWETSDDKGKKWNISFRGVYTKHRNKR